MRLTLLEMVQHILSAMGSDEVDSYSDTVESYQIALLIKQVFYDAAVELNLPTHNGMFELNASLDPALPTLMTVPTGALRVDTVHYDNKTATDTYSQMVQCDYLPFEDFRFMQTALQQEPSNVGEMTVSSNGETFPVMYATNRFPRYYTTVGENTVLFDAYDSTVDTTLQKSKTMVQGVVYPTFTLSDSAYPDLDPSQFPYLLAKAKTRAFNEIKQTANQESASEARRQKIVLQKRKHLIKKVDPIYELPRYGRK